MFLLSVLAWYYAQINSGNTSPEILQDYAIVESIVANVDPKQVVTVINLESGFDPKRIHINDGKVGCNSIGLVQIRDCDHPNISKAQAEDPIFAVNFLISNIDRCTTWWKSTCPLHGD